MFVGLVVSDLLMNEAVKDRKEKCLTKCEDSGHDSGQSSLNTGDPFCFKLLLHIFNIFRL